MKIYNLKALFATALLSIIAVSCEDDTVMTDSPSNYVSFEPNKTVYVPDGETETIDLKVFATQASGVDRTIVLILDEVASTLPDANYSLPTSVTIPAGETEAVFQVSNIVPDGANKRIVIGFQEQDGVTFAQTWSSASTAEGTVYTVNSRKITITVTEICGENPFRIELIADQWGTEITWELYNSSFDLVASGGPYTNASAANAPNGPFPQPNVDLCLPSGEYTFYAYDSYGDGWSTDHDEDGVIDYTGSYRLIKMTPFGEVQEVIRTFSNPNPFTIDEFTFSL